MEYPDHVYAPKPIRSKINFNSYQRRTFDMEINNNPKPTNFIQCTTPSINSSSDASTIIDNEITFSSFKNGIDQENFYEEIHQILSNDFPFDFENENLVIPVVPQRPKNPFYKNLESELSLERKEKEN